MLTRVLQGVVVALLSLLAPMVLLSATPADAATTVHIRLRAAVRSLPVSPETPAGYARSRFKLWIDANGDCQDTRAEVLVSESKIKAVGGCSIETGRWVSYYDRRTWSKASDVDIDHLVPLKEAWDSGAKRWNAGTRKRYANDLQDRRTLVAVTDNVNQSKGDRDPADWMPQYGRCKYVGQWTAVKIRWGLKVNRAEKTQLARVASRCKNVVLTVTKARIIKGSTSHSGGGSGSGGLDPQFQYCYQAQAAGYGPYYRGKDPEYYWYTDADNDGVVCE